MFNTVEYSLKEIFAKFAGLFITPPDISGYEVIVEGGARV
jgi:hypothetical protein